MMRAPREPVPSDRRPLHLPIEPYVRCPRAGMVPVERCFGCNLLQGTLSGDHPEILCAYPVGEPALRRTVAMGPGAGRRAPAERGRPPKDLIFERDWPDE